MAIIKEKLIDLPNPITEQAERVVHLAGEVIRTHYRLERVIRERAPIWKIQRSAKDFDRASGDFLRWCSVLPEVEITEEGDIGDIWTARNLAYERGGR